MARKKLAQDWIDEVVADQKKTEAEVDKIEKRAIKRMKKLEGM